MRMSISWAIVFYETGCVSSSTSETQWYTIDTSWSPSFFNDRWDKADNETIDQTQLSFQVLIDFNIEDEEWIREAN